METVPYLRFFLYLFTKVKVVLILDGGPCYIFAGFPSPISDVQQTVVEDNKILPHCLHCVCDGGDRRLDDGFHLLDSSLEREDQRIVSADLPIDLAPLGNITCFFQLPGAGSLVNGRLFIQTSLSMTAVVDALVNAGVLQCPVDCLSPGCPPCCQLIFAVPSGRDGILSAVFCAVRILGQSLKALLCGFRWSEVQALVTDLVKILFLPAIAFGLLVFSGSETLFLVISDTEIFLFGLVLPCSIWIERAHSQQDIRRMLRSRSIDQVGVFTKLAAELQLPDYEEEIYRNLHRWTDNAENQEISLLALFMCGCEEKLIALFTDPAFRLILSFRQLHELFDCYSGGHAELYRKLLARDCDLYVKRACVRGIGNEGLTELSPLIEPYLTSDHMNLLIDSVRSAGKLRYRPPDDILRRHTSHREWSVRSVAVTALADIAPEACYEDLLRCLCDPEWWVRFHAAEALSRLRGHEDLMENVTGLGDRFAYEMMRYILERNALLGREVTA